MLLTVQCLPEQTIANVCRQFTYTGNYVEVTYELNSATTPVITIRTKFVDAHAAATGTYDGGGLGPPQPQGNAWTGLTV